MNENLDMRGTLTLRLTDQDGRLVHEQRCHNRIVTSGRRLVAQLFTGVTTGVPPSKVTHMAVGTDGATPADADAGLRAQRGARNPISDVTYTEFDETSAGQVVKRVKASLTAVFDYGDANGTDPLREAGVFNADTGGVIYNRVVFDPVTKTNAFRLTLLWDIVF